MPGEFDSEFEAAPDAVALDAEFDAAPAPVGVSSYVGPGSVKTLPGQPFTAPTTESMLPGSQSTGAPAQDLWSKAKEVGTNLWTGAQDFSLGVGQGQLMTVPQGEMSMPQKVGYALGAGTTPKMDGRLGDAARLMNARVTKAVNLFAGGHVSQKLEDTPEAEAGGRAIQSGARDLVEASDPAKRFLSPQQRETAADVLSGVVQVGTEAVAGGTVNPIPGMNAAGKVAKFVPIIGKSSPKLAAFLIGALEAGVTMPVYGVLGAEEGTRAQTLEELLTKPTWDKVAFMALGGLGAAHGNAVRRQAEYRSEQRGRISLLGNEAVKAGDSIDRAIADRKASDERKVLAIISEEKMAQQANDLEQKVAMERGEIVQPVIKDKLSEFQEQTGSLYADREGANVEAGGALPQSPVDPVAQAYELAYGKPLSPGWETGFTALDSGTVRPDAPLKVTGPVKAEGALLGSGRANRRPLRDTIGDFGEESLKELPPKKPYSSPLIQTKGRPPEFPATVAVTESPTAGKGVRMVIQWVGYGSEPRVEVHDIHNYEDAKAARKSLDKSGVDAEVSFSDKAKEALWQKNDPLLNDLLIFSEKELKDGKRGATVGNRTAALVASGTEAPHVESLSSHKVKAAAAENNGAVLMGTANGPRWALYRGTDQATGNLLFIPADEKSLGPTINKVESIPDGEVLRYVHKPESWELERYFRDGAMPVRADKLQTFGTATPGTLTINRRKAAPWTVTNAERTRVDITQGKWQQVLKTAMSPDAAVDIAESPLGSAIGFEPGGHQGPIAGAGGTKRASLTMREGASPAGMPPAGGGSGGGKPPPRPLGPEPVPMPERKPTINEFPETVLDSASNVDKLFKAENHPWLMRALKLTIGEHLSAPMELQYNIAASIAANQMERVKGDWITAQKKAGLSLNNRSMDLALEEVGKGNLSLNDFLNKHFAGPEMALARGQVKEVVESMMHRSTFLHNELVKRGIIHPRDQMFTESGANRYFARTTLAFLLKPGEWLKIVEKDDRVWLAAKNFLMKQHPDKGAGDVDMMMRDMLNNEDPEAAFFADPRFGNAASHVKARKQMPPELKALFGQLTRDPQSGKLTGGVSGVYGFAETLAAQETLYHRALVMEELANNPLHAAHSLPEGVDSVGPGSLYEGWSRMPDNRAQFGKLAGMVVSPALKDALVNLPKMHEWGTTNAIMRAAREISALTKGNETALGSGSYYMNNILGGVQHMMMAGVGPHELGGVPGQASMVRSLRLVAQGIADYKANPHALPGSEHDTPAAQFIRDARRVGADVAGFGSVEIAHGAVEDIHANIAKEILGDKNSNAIDTMTRVVTAYKKYRKFQGEAGHMGDAIDRYWRLSTFATLVDKRLAKTVARGEKATPQQYEDALRWSARRIATAFPMPDRLGVIPDQMRRYTGAFAPYLTYRTEVLRNYMMLPKTLIEDPAVGINLAMWGITLYGLKAVVDKLDPISDDLLRKERARFTQSMRKYIPASVYAHMTGKDGRPVFLNLTQMFEPLRYLQGPFDHPVLNAGFGLLGAVFGGGSQEQHVQQLAGASAPNMSQDVAKRKDWNTGALAAIDFAWNDLSLGPKFPQKLWQEYQSALPQPALPMESYAQQDPKVAAGRALGVDLVRQPETGKANMERLREVNNFTRATKELSSRKEGGAVPGRGLVQSAGAALRQQLTGVSEKKADLKDLKTNWKERNKK